MSVISTWLMDQEEKVSGLRTPAMHARLGQRPTAREPHSRQFSPKRRS
jgi:hypothetical protein